MSGRKLGGGRILGNGKGLAPPSSPSVQPRAPRATSPFAPSDSSTSQYSNSQNSLSPLSSSPLPNFGPQDVVSNISIGGPSNGASTSTKLVCPICEEEMVRTMWTHHMWTWSLIVLIVDVTATQQTYRRQPSRNTRGTTGRGQDMVRQTSLESKALPTAVTDQLDNSRARGLRIE